MQVQFREQTPGVRAGEWWDSTTDKYHSVVTIQSLDGWVGYIGDKRINKDFSTHEDAAAYAISILEGQSVRRSASRRLIRLAVPVAAVIFMAFGVHSVFFAGSETTPQIATATTTDSITTGSISNSAAAPKVKIAKYSSSTADRDVPNRHVDVASTHVSNKSRRDKEKTTSKSEALPSIQLHQAEARPWEKPLSEHAAAKEPVASDPTPHAKAAHPTTRHANLDEPRAVKAELETSTDAVDASSETFYDTDLEADMRADKAERARFLQEEQAEATVTRAEIKPNDKAEDAAQLDEIAGPANPLHSAPISKTKNLPTKTVRKVRSTKRARKKSRTPLVRRIVRRNIFGQRYVVYKARRPRNQREYRKLQRIKRRIAAKRRRYFKKQYGY